MLPLAGGLFDQPGLYLKRMEIILHARQDKEEHERKLEEGKERLKNLGSQHA